MNRVVEAGPATHMSIQLREAIALADFVLEIEKSFIVCDPFAPFDRNALCIRMERVQQVVQ